MWLSDKKYGQNALCLTGTLVRTHRGVQLPEEDFGLNVTWRSNQKLLNSMHSVKNGVQISTQTRFSEIFPLEMKD
jgi:hypothetical protein